MAGQFRVCCRVGSGRASGVDEGSVAVAHVETMARGPTQLAEGDIRCFLTGINCRGSEVAVQVTGGDNYVRKGKVEVILPGWGPIGVTVLELGSWGSEGGVRRPSWKLMDQSV